MKLFTPLLLALSLAAGTIACMTAYSPRLEAVAKSVAAGAKIELGAPAGRTTGADGTVAPVAAAGERLTPGIIATLSEAGVERVRVRQFSFARWSHGWLFAAAAAGLGVGAVLVKREARRGLQASLESQSDSAHSPVVALECIRKMLRQLDAEMPALRDAEGGMGRVTETIGEMQSTHIDTILQSRERMIAAGGLKGFAAFMSAFSVLERQINRAWSAAADDAAGEVERCVKNALRLIDDVERLLPR